MKLECSICKQRNMIALRAKGVPWYGGERTELLHRSKRVRTPVALLRSDSLIKVLKLKWLFLRGFNTIDQKNEP